MSEKKTGLQARIAAMQAAEKAAAAKSTAKTSAFIDTNVLAIYDPKRPRPITIKNFFFIL